MKSCAEPTGCGEPISINFGVLGRTTVNSKCCSTELCNTQNVPAYTNNTPNSHKCFTCDKEDCTKTMNCLGPEDRCIKSFVTAGDQTIVIKGCATSNVCDLKPPKEILNTIGMELNCFERNLCNNAKRAVQNLFLLLVSLIPITLFPGHSDTALCTA
ncbi:urokinase plasminogen activator surface receptor-like isoform X2 [Amia ocellicauda]